MIAVIIVSLICLVVLILGCFISWTVHLSMVKDNCKEYGWGNFRKFKENLKKYGLKKDDGWSTSYFNRSNNSQYHAGIVKFNGVGMLLPVFSYVKVGLYIKKISKEPVKKVKW